MLCRPVCVGLPSLEIRILSFADAAVDPVYFALAPEVAIRRALGFAGLETVSCCGYPHPPMPALPPLRNTWRRVARAGVVGVRVCLQWERLSKRQIDSLLSALPV